MDTVTAVNLAQLVGQRTLQFDLETFKRLLSTLAENQATLDKSALNTIGELLNSVTATSTDAHAKIQNIYQETIKNLDEASHHRLQNLWKNIANLPDLTPETKQAMSLKAMEHAHQEKMHDRKIVGTNSNIITASIASVAVIAAAGIAYKVGRKPTFLESIFGKK